MWEALELENEDILWAGIAFTGGLGGHQEAPCGAVSASAICFGLQRSCSLDDKKRAKQARLDARSDAKEFTKSFEDQFGTINCLDLVGLDFSKPEEALQFRELGVWKEKCDKFVQFTLEKLYEFDQKRNVSES